MRQMKLQQRKQPDCQLSYLNDRSPIYSLQCEESQLDFQTVYDQQQLLKLAFTAHEQAALTHITQCELALAQRGCAAMADLCAAFPNLVGLAGTSRLHSVLGEPLVVFGSVQAQCSDCTLHDEAWESVALPVHVFVGMTGTTCLGKLLGDCLLIKWPCEACWARLLSPSPVLQKHRQPVCCIATLVGLAGISRLRSMLAEAVTFGAGRAWWATSAWYQSG